MSEPEQTEPPAAGRGPAESVAATLLDRIVDRVSAGASVQAVYGEPVTCEGVTVIPVARVAFGFGGGAGRGQHAAQVGEGGGGGGGADARPLGFIEISAGRAVFRPIRDPWSDVLRPLTAIAIAAAPVLARAWLRRSYPRQAQGSGGGPMFVRRRRGARA